LDGFLIPGSAVGEHPVEFVFLGDGLFQLVPDDPIEQQQLELITTHSALDERFHTAVFVITNAAAAQRAVTQASESPLSVTDQKTAAEVFSAWLKSSERRLTDATARMYADALGDPLNDGYFSGLFSEGSLGSFLYTFDPMAREQISLGQFLRPELDRQERRKTRRQLSHAQRQGKLIGVELKDLGRWIPWVSSALHNADGATLPGSPGFESVHYHHDITLRGRELTMRATTTITLRALVDGLRTATLAMHPDLTPLTVTDEEGHPLEFFRSAQELVVVLPEETAAGTPLTLAVSFSSHPFANRRFRTFYMHHPLDWHPRVGDVDWATFSAVVRWPKGLSLIGNGQVINSGATDSGLQWQRRSLDIPCTGFSFEIGDYEVSQHQVGHIQVTIALDRGDYRASRDLDDQLATTIADVMELYEQSFGTYPLDSLEVVTSPRPYSQGLLGCITLSTPALSDLGQWGQLIGLQSREMVIAHELAHLWWGNLVGFQSYRDLWISEAMANYGAMQYARQRLAAGDDSLVGAGPTSNWAKWLLATTAWERPIEALGPVVLGTRLSSAYGRRVYEAIVYKKGALVLDMLAHLTTEPRFAAMLRLIVAQNSSRVLTTEAFFHAIEQLSDLDLDWFVRQYVDGTGFPEVFYSFEVAPTEQGTWVLSGSCEQRARLMEKVGVVRRTDGDYDVTRTLEQGFDVASSQLVVPIEIAVTPVSSSSASASSRQDVLHAIQGSLLIKGPTTPFRIELEQHPLSLRLDPHQELFARFFCTTCWPRQALLAKGIYLLAQGKTQAAEQVLLSGFNTPLQTPSTPWQRPPDATAWSERFLSAQLHLALARLYLDSNRPAAAAQQLDRIRDMITRSDRWRLERSLLATEARLHLHTDRPDLAYHRLSTTLADQPSPGDSGENFALLAIAAAAVGKKMECVEALEEAHRRGVVGTLPCSAPTTEHLGRSTELHLD